MPESAQYRVYFVTTAQIAPVFYVDSFQSEIQRGSGVTPYCDGAQGLNQEWFGTAHASESRRKAGLIASRGFELHFTRDTYIAFDRVASATDGGSIFMRAGADWSPEHPIHADDRISFVNSVVGEQPRVWGVIWGVHQGKAE